MTIYGILCGLTDFTNIADFLKIKEDYFTELLGLENGTPSHYCLSDIFARIDSKKIMEIFIEWIKEILVSANGKNISIDGKAVRSAIDKTKLVCYTLNRVEVCLFNKKKEGNRFE